ncbi:MAG: flagellar hook-length control protein [Pseudomonadota bacterium]|nr:flagellar hook-length control protein [Pseudomonadota bacterium]
MAAVIMGGAVGLLALNSTELNTAARGMLVLAMLGAALAVVHATCWRQKCWHIDISGHGQIRLSSYAGEPLQAGSGVDTAPVWQLLPGSLLHPQLLILHLQSHEHRLRLPIWSDSVSPEAFRRLSVACRWIAARQSSPNKNSHELDDVQ